jgi:PleD family two-component response regulator
MPAGRHLRAGNHHDGWLRGRRASAVSAPSLPRIQMMNRPPRSVAVALSGDSLRAELLDALLVDRNDYDLTFVDSIVRGYARVRELKPDLVVVFMDIEDVAACKLLSMLRADDELSHVPVVTCVMAQATPAIGTSSQRHRHLAIG